MREGYAAFTGVCAARAGRLRRRVLQPFSLRTRVGLTLAALVFAVAGTIGAIIGEASVRELRERIGQSLASDAARIADRLNRDMAARARELALLGALDPMRTLRDPREVQALLDGLKRSVPDYLWVGVTDPQGRVVAATEGALIGTDFSSRAEFREGLSGHPTRLLPDVQRAPRTPGQVVPAAPEEIRPITLSHPVRAADGTVAGVIVAQIGWNWVRDLGSAQTTPDPGGARQMLLLSAQDLVLVGPAGTVGTRLALSAAARARAGFSGWTVQPWPSGPEAGRDTLVGAAYAGGEGPHPGPGSQEMRWTVLVREDAAAAFAPARELRSLILLTGMALAAAFAAAGWAATGRIIRPLRRLTQAADRLRQGDDVQIPALRGPQEIATLAHSLRALVATLTSKQIALDELQVLARHDPLTGLLNRIGLQAWLQGATGRAEAGRRGLLVLVGDLDGFKAVNDTLGHPAGDALLCAVAQRLSAATRPEDAVARLGGDEFVVVLDAPAGARDSAALDVAQRLWAGVTGRYAIAGEEVRIGLSMGGALWPHADPDLGRVMEIADAVLYAVKRGGKGRIELQAPPGFEPQPAVSAAAGD